MKRMIGFIVAVAFIAVGAAAQEKATTWQGYLVDKMCGSKMTGEKGEQKAMKHTKDCALEDACKASGFGLVTGGMFVKFTEASDAQAEKFLVDSKMESNIFVKVTGKLDGEKISVTSIEPAKKAAKKAMKAEKKS